MNRKKVILISFLMGIALIGLVALQVNWIRHDFLLRQERFTQQANDAVMKAIDKIGTKASVHFIAREFNDQVNDSVFAFFRDNGFPEIPEIPEAVIPIEHIIDSTEKSMVYTYVTPGDSDEEQKIELIARDNDPEGKVVIRVESESSKAKDELKAVKSEMDEASRALKTAREKLKWQQERQRKQEVKLRQVIRKMEVEFEQRKDMLLERIVPGKLDSLVGTELTSYGIALPYSMQLINGKNDSLLWSRNAPDVGGDTGVVINARVFPDDIISNNDSVRISFPDTLGYFLSSMWLMLASSALFTLIVIFAFSYTIHVILRQKKVSEMKNDFINNMTHEFKTPIATIKLAADAMMQPGVKDDEAKRKYYTEIIKAENERMNEHVENILQLAQFDKSTFVVDPVEIDMHDIIKNTVVMMQLHATELGGKIIFNANAQDHKIMADRRFIPIVIQNLVDNAIKYHNGPPEIIINTSNENGFLVVSVSDNGIGMNTQTLKNIFEKFYRVPSGDIHNVKGFGLGLSYVKAIVTAHGGTVEVSSESGKGSTFVVRLPLIN